MSLLVLLMLLCGALQEAKSQTNRPNIVFILADDLGWNDVSFHGSKEIPTPNLDALAYDGIILSNYYVQPLCTPTRASLMTGRYPLRYGLQHSVLTSARPYGLLLNETIMPQYLKQLGYSSHIVGKWHLGFFADEYIPTRRGFDSHFGYYQGCEDYLDHTHAADDYNTKAWGLDLHRNEEVVRTAFGQYSTEIFMKEAENIIEDHDVSKPLFLYVAQQAVHSGNQVTPLEAPAKYVERMSHIKNKQRRLYAAMVSALDDSVGNITRALHQRGMLNNTIIVFSTDNGGPANGFDMNDANNWPLRGLKATLWEGGVRATGFIWSPLLKNSGYTSQHLIHVTDWLPTLLHAAGYDSNKLSSSLDGVDQWESISRNLPTNRTEILLNNDPLENSSSIRVGSLKLLYAKKGYTVDCRNWYKPDRTTVLENSCAMNTEGGIKSNIKTVDDNIPSENYIPVNGESKAYHANKEESPIDKHFQQNDLVHRFDAGNSAGNSDHMWYPQQMEQLRQILRAIGRSQVEGTPLVLECGARPENASTNCLPWIRPCLYNITSDPCEFNNLIDSMPDVVNKLLQKMVDYEKESIYPIQVPIDDQGLPYHHDDNWVPWIKLGETSDAGDLI